MILVFFHRLNKKRVERWALIILPLLVLVVDLLVFRVIFESRQQISNVDIVSLVTRQVVSLGTFRGHRIFVVIDDIRNSKYLSYVQRSPNALIISHFVDSESSESSVGALGSAVLEKLKVISSVDNRKLRDRLGQIKKGRPGEILEVSFTIPKDQYHRFPIDHLFIFLIEQGPSNEKRDVILKGMGELLRLAEKKNISGLIIPCIGYNWQDKNSISFDDCFQAVFSSLGVASSPRDIYLSLYMDWPTFTLEEAVSTINRMWEKAPRSSYPSLPTLFRRDFRLILILLSACLFVCSRYAPLTAKNFVIIVCSFVGSATASSTLVAFFTQGYDDSFRSYLQILVWIALAIGLPFFVEWNPKAIFSRDRS